ncbi:hypothetical protein GGS20DRAFT_553120 [Poronia punctata]|nr:hypothetical protein GGS20DRAFT_553120 [Poronia punctata]
MAQNNGAARAVQNVHLNRADQRPLINVEVDLSYSMQRYVNSHLHAEDRVLRPPPQNPGPNNPPLTVAQSKARMAGILAAQIHVPGR